MSQEERCPLLEGECRREIESLETVLPRGWLEGCADCNKFWTCKERKELLKPQTGKDSKWQIDA